MYVCVASSGFVFTSGAKKKNVLNVASEKILTRYSRLVSRPDVEKQYCTRSRAVTRKMVRHHSRFCRFCVIA